MQRREFIALLGAAPLTMRPKIALAQTTSRMPKIAVLIVGSPDDPESPMLPSAFEQGMRVAGWTKDVNVQIDYHWCAIDPQHAAAAAADVAASKPDAIVAVGSPVVLATQQVTATIPIVFAKPQAPARPADDARQHAPAGRAAPDWLLAAVRAVHRQKMHPFQPI